MCHNEVFSHIITFMILCQSVKVRLDVKSIPWPYMISDLQRLNFFLEIYQAFNLCGHAVGEHFVKVSTIISESVNQSSILYHWGGTYQTTRDVSEWVRHMPVDHRCQGHAHKILFHAWPGDNWGLFDVKKTIIWKKSAFSQVNGARASIQVPALLTQSHAFSCLSLPRNFFKEKFIRFATYRH